MPAPTRAARHLLAVLALLSLAACQITGVAPPSGDAAYSGGLNYLGESGSRAP